MTARPQFDHDYAYGLQGELMTSGLVAGLISGVVRLEDKRKRRPDAWFYVEIEHDPGRTGHYLPSGISVFTADYLNVILGDTGIHLFIPISRIREAIRLGLGRPAEERDGSCPTRGRLLHLEQVACAKCDPS